MKARQIAKCRKKISSKDYLRRRAELLEEQCIRLFHFLAMKCSTCYVKIEEADYNRFLHKKYGNRIKKKLAWYEKRMTDNSKSIFIDKTNERTIV